MATGSRQPGMGRSEPFRLPGKRTPRLLAVSGRHLRILDKTLKMLTSYRVFVYADTQFWALFVQGMKEARARRRREPNLGRW